MTDNEDFNRKNNISKVVLSDTNKRFILNSSKDKNLYTDIIYDLTNNKKKLFGNSISDFKHDYTSLDKFCIDNNVSVRLLKYVNSLLFIIAYKLLKYITSDNNMKIALDKIETYLPNKKALIIKYYRFLKTRN